MATQAALIADTIAGMKRAISSHNYSSDSGDSIDRCTNRGNKLKRKARYVQEGQLDRPNGPRVYKQRIEHAGYHRDVISQIPKRYDLNGDRLEDDEEDEEADAAAAEANPYSEVVLHGTIELLAPLTSAAGLPTHPSLSDPYMAPILDNMTQEACVMLQHERNTIRGAKQILTKLRGDDVWIPCGSLDSDVDDMIFDTSKVFEDCIRLRPSSKVKRTADDIVVPATTLLPSEDDVDEGTKAGQVDSTGIGDEDESAPSLKLMNRHIAEGIEKPTTLSEKPDGTGDPEKMDNAALDGVDGKTVTQDFETLETSSNAHPPQSEAHPTNEEKDTSTDENNTLVGDTETAETVWVDDIDGTQTSTTVHIPQTEEKRSLQIEDTQDGPEQLQSDSKEDVDMIDAEEPQAANNGLQPMVHRMTTRAQAQAVSDNATSSRTRSASATSSLLPSIHPLFIMPSGACPDRDWGLPPEEAEATRRILMSYVQKQEEVCRGAEKLYNGFLKAQRMKKNVLDSCKAEGHLGEMSDGEDWYDKEEWGLEEDLRKGHDEDEDDVGTQHKKTRRRAA
ncbi:MAG: hypothetical protein Q9213_005327 [Squamulea squamosa]